MFRVIIAGSRSFNDYKELARFADIKLQNITDEIEIVSGGAIGADALGGIYARERGYKLKIFPANWRALGRKAGYVRNEEMAKYANALIAFWDGESKGTKHMIDIARSMNLAIGVDLYNEKAQK